MGSKLVTLARLAWANRFGLVRLSVIPEDATDPVVVGANDERLPSEYPTETDNDGLPVYGPQRELRQWAQTGVVYTEDGIVYSADLKPSSTLLTDEEGTPFFGEDPRARHEIAFAWGDASPRTIFTVPASPALTLWRVGLLIDEPFNGVNPSVSVGDVTDAGRLMAAGQNDPLTAGVYASNPAILYTPGDEIRISITPGAGATAGSGKVQLFF